MSRHEPLPHRDGELALSAQVFRPEGEPRAAIAVFPTILNSTPAVEAKARALAEAGYLAVICDFYGERPEGIEQAFGWAERLRADVETYRARRRGLDAVRSVAVPREQVLAFWQEMDRAGADWHFHAYSGVKHGFTNPGRPAGNPAVAYDASADRQSWAAMLSLFDEVFDN